MQLCAKEPTGTGTSQCRATPAKRQLDWSNVCANLTAGLEEKKKKNFGKLTAGGQLVVIQVKQNTPGLALNSGVGLNLSHIRGDDHKQTKVQREQSESEPFEPTVPVSAQTEWPGSDSDCTRLDQRNWTGPDWIWWLGPLALTGGDWWNLGVIFNGKNVFWMEGKQT